MPFSSYETIDKTLERRRRMQAQVPDLRFGTPDEVLQVDAVRSAQNRPPSRISIHGTQLAATVAQRREAMRRAGEAARTTVTPSQQRRADYDLRERELRARPNPIRDARSTPGYFRAVDRASMEGPKADSQWAQIGRSVPRVTRQELDDGYNTAIYELQQRGTPDADIEIGKLQYQRAYGVPFEQAQYGEDLSLGALGSTGLQAAGFLATNVDRLTGAPVRAAALLRNPYEGMRDPGAQSARDIGGIRSIPETFFGWEGPAGLGPRDITAGVADVLLDVGTVAGGVGLAGRGARAIGRGAQQGAFRGLSDEAAEAALRSAAGPTEAFDTATPALRPLRGADGIVPGAVEPVIPGVTPRGRANVRGAAPTVSRGTFDAPPTVRRLYGVDTIEEGATRGRVERFIESGRIRPDEPVATPGLLVRAEARNAVRNQATNVGERSRAIIADSGFEFDDAGRIPNLAGVDPDIPGAPTLRDVAARLPKYEPYLTDAQIDALEALRTVLAPYRQGLDEVAQEAARITGKPSAINLGSRADVMEGGFYIPRGTAETEELADIASRRVTGGGGRTGKAGFEKTATFPSEAAGIEAGYAYTPVADSIAGYVRQIGDRTLDQHAANYFLSRTDEAGNRIAETVAQRAMRLDPKLRSEMTALRTDLQGLRGAESRLTARQTKVIDDFLSDPDFGDIDALKDAIDSIRVGTFRGQPGRNFGMDIADVQGMKQAVLDRIEELRPEWRRLQKQSLATPRDQGRIPLRGLEAYSFPWEVADEAKRILEGETRNPGASLNALNSLLRGVQATGEMSYLGIQGAIGMASGNRAWRRATKAATEAWLNGGENSLGRHIVQFDRRAADAGLPSVEEWASKGLRLGGGNTEFAITGRGVIPDLKDVPVVGKAQEIAGSVPKRADRGFGTFGDVIRLELADTLADEAKRAGRALDDVEMKSIIDTVNRSTGWSPTRLGGSVGEMLNFAPRFLAARIQALGQLASSNPATRRYARRLIGRYIAIASLLTLAVNQITGEETDFRPFSGSKGPTWNPLDAEYKNPNFMRVRNVLGRDWSLLGPVDSTLGVAIGAGSLISNPTADPKEALNRMRSVFTSPLASAGLDWLVFGENFDGEKLDNAEALGSDLLTRVVPFAAPELADTTIESAGQAREGDIGGAAAGVAGGVLQSGVGLRASPLTVREQVKQGKYNELDADDQFKAVPAQTWLALSKNPAFERATTRYETYGQWYQDTSEQMYQGLLERGVEPGEARDRVEAEIRKQPVYQAYQDVRKSLVTKWVKDHPAEAVALWNEESKKPWQEREWNPTKEQTELMNAYLAATREPATP